MCDLLLKLLSETRYRWDDSFCVGIKMVPPHPNNLANKSKKVNPKKCYNHNTSFYAMFQCFTHIFLWLMTGFIIDRLQIITRIPCFRPKKLDPPTTCICLRFVVVKIIDQSQCFVLTKPPDCTSGP